MKTITVSQFQAQFVEIVAQVKDGTKIMLTLGKQNEVIGYFVPSKYGNLVNQKNRVLGPLKAIGYHMAENFFETTD